MLLFCESFFFFFNDTATTDIYTLSLHDALPIYLLLEGSALAVAGSAIGVGVGTVLAQQVDRKSTRLNSSHGARSYAVFCVKKQSSGRSSRWPVVVAAVSLLVRATCLVL